jgi:hypothetical protein
MDEGKKRRRPTREPLDEPPPSEPPPDDADPGADPWHHRVMSWLRGDDVERQARAQDALAGSSMESEPPADALDVSAELGFVAPRARNAPQPRSRLDEIALESEPPPRHRPPAGGARPAARPAAPAAPARPAARAQPMPAGARPAARPAPRTERRGLDLERLLRLLPDPELSADPSLRRLLAQLLGDTEVVRNSARRSLASMDREIVEPLLLALASMPEPELVQVGLDGLAEIRSDRLRSCVAAVLTSSEVQVRQAALQVAQRIRGDAARPFFLHAALDPSVDIRRRAVLYLSWREEPWAPTVLRSLCCDSHPLVSWPALRALGTLDPRAAEEILSTATFARFPGYRRIATRLLRAMPPGAPKRAERPTRRTVPPKAAPSSIPPSSSEPPRRPGR